MKKTLYSLMLSEDVVAEVDRLAHRMGTNRSNLINQILAEHVDLVTPERRINDIFTAIEQLMTPSSARCSGVHLGVKSRRTFASTAVRS
mgnify:CR=1 FL=1